MWCVFISKRSPPTQNSRVAVFNWIDFTFKHSVTFEDMKNDPRTATVHFYPEPFNRLINLEADSSYFKTGYSLFLWSKFICAVVNLILLLFPRMSLHCPIPRIPNLLMGYTAEMERVHRKYKNGQVWGPPSLRNEILWQTEVFKE